MGTNGAPKFGMTEDDMQRVTDAVGVEVRYGREPEENKASRNAHRV